MLDASGQGESAVACRRMERLAQAQGDLNGDHAAAETTRRRPRAREHAANVAGAFSVRRILIRRWLESSLAKH